MKKLLYIITGSSFAKYSHVLLEQLVKHFDVSVLIGENAQIFVEYDLIRDLVDHEKIYVYILDNADEPLHVQLAIETDITLVAPITYNSIGKLTYGIADTTISQVMAAVDFEHLYIAPAMNKRYLTNPIYRTNISMLKNFGVHIFDPEFEESPNQTMGSMMPSENITQYLIRKYVTEE